MNSLRLLQISAVVATLAFGSYVMVKYVIDWKETTEVVTTSTDSGLPNNGLPDNAKRDILSYVPADTIYFFGGLEPSPLKNMLEILAPEWRFTQAPGFKQQFQQELSKNTDTPPAAAMLSGLFIEYLDVLKDLKTATDMLGVGSEMDAVFYSVGTTPVMRMKLSDMNAFNAFVKNAETAAQVTPVQESHGALTFKTYSFSKPGISTQESTDVKLAISVNNNYAVITLLTPLETQETRDVILGVKKPANPLTHTTLLQDLKVKYGFHPAYLGYINHEEIMTGLTAPDGNEFGRMLGAMIKTVTQQKTTNQPPQQAGVTPESESKPEQTSPAISEPATENPLAPMQTAECRSELLAITKRWPRTVFGYTELNLKTKPKKMAARMLVENTDAAFLQQLQKLRGFIPAHLRQTESRPVFGVGIGFNVDELTPFVSQAINDFTQKDYQCQMLVEMKQKLVASNPVLALGMMTGMAAGIEGISATILDIDGAMNFSQPSAAPDIRRLDAIVTLSAKDPQRLLMMAANFQQGMPPIQLPADGTPVDLPIPLPTPNLGPIKLAHKGNHIVAYIGDKAEKLAQNMANDPLAATGLFTFNMDFGKYMRFVSDAALAADATEGKMAEQDKTMLKEMTKIDRQLVESFDITPQGIAFDAAMTMP
jgi:hypothetical protein